MKETVLGKSSHWSGRFDLVNDDGTITRLGGDEDNSLFHAVTKATHPELNDDEVKEKSQFLRSEVGDEVSISINPDLCCKIVRDFLSLVQTTSFGL